MDGVDRKREIINDCLQLLVERGLSQTTTRDLSKAMKLKSGGMYYYFNTKDDLIIACAEEAVVRVEDCLFTPALKEIMQPKQMMERLQRDAAAMAPTMQFFVSVCTDKRYSEGMRPVLGRVGRWYAQYADRFAAALKTDTKEITPFVFMMITAFSNYMIFGEASFVLPQLHAVQIKIERLISNETA